MLNGLIWVIVIFVLQAVIAGLAKRAQQNAQQKPPNGAQPTTGDLIDPTQPVRVANAPKKAKLPKVADASTVVVKRPTSIVTGKRSATATTTTAAKVQRSATGATGKSVSAPPAARPAPVAVTPPKVTSPRVVARPEAPEEADAMASRAKVAASIARIRSIESSVSSSHVTGLGKNLGKPITAATQPAVSGAATRRDALTPAAIAQSLRNPQRIREAIIVSEVLGPPRGAR
jgi:hypothetical protein